MCHSVENAAADLRFALLRGEEAGAKGSAEDRLIPIEGVLGAGLLMVAGLLLPLAFTDPLSPADVAVSPAGWSVALLGQHGGLPWRDYDINRRALMV